MKKISVTSCFLAVLFLLTLGCLRSSESPVDAKVTIECAAQRKRYFLMEPIVFQVKLKNIGSLPLKYYFSATGAANRYKVVVRDEQGKLVPDTLFAKNEIELANQAKMSWSGSQRLDPDLKPGAVDTVDLIVNQYADMTSNTVGYYDIQIERFGVVSNTVRVQMISRPFNMNDKDIQDAVRTGFYSGSRL